MKYSFKKLNSKIYNDTVKGTSKLRTDYDKEFQGHCHQSRESVL